MFYKNVPLTAEKEINDETRIWIRAVKYYEVLGNFFVLKKNLFLPLILCFTFIVCVVVAWEVKYFRVNGDICM